MDKREVNLRDGVKIAYLEQGQGTPIVLLHGFCGSSAYWDSILPLLAATGRLIVPDLRGHGSSSAPQEAYSIEAMAEDIAALLQALKIPKAVLLGHSLGGYITLAFAEKYPDRLLGFGLVHSTAYPDDEKGKQGRLNSIQTIKEKGLPEFINGLIPKLFATDHLETMAQAVEKAKEIGRGTSPDGAMKTLEAMRERPDRNSVLQSAQVPLLLVAGEKDQIIAAVKTFTVEGAHVTKHKLDGCGHMSMMEAPEKLADVIRDYVKQF